MTGIKSTITVRSIEAPSIHSTLAEQSMSKTKPEPSAAVLIIGNEILSGRTQDRNVQWLAQNLTSIGIRLLEVRIVGDNEDMIVAALNYLRTAYTYVFTTGGIGPTHDDITSLSVAKAFSLPLIRNKDAVNIMETHYAEGNLSEDRLKMADIPQGASLIANPISAAPGFCVDNVYVMAGVPEIMRAMFDGVKATLRGGKKILSRSVQIWKAEVDIAEELKRIQLSNQTVEIGSYPFIRRDRIGVNIVVRGTDKKKISTVITKLKRLGAEGQPDNL